MLPFTIAVVLARSTSGDHFFNRSLCRPPPHQGDWGRAKAAFRRFARDDKELPAGGPLQNGTALSAITGLVTKNLMPILESSGPADAAGAFIISVTSPEIMFN